METRSKYSKRKLIESEDFKPIKLPKILGGLENQENYVYKKFIKPEKKIFLDETQDNEKLMQKDIKIDDFFDKQHVFKIGYVICEICKKQIKETNYEKHCVEHYRTETCEKCLKSFTEIGIQRHTCKIFKCETCGKIYTNRSKFESHLRHHARIEERKSLCAYYVITCPICNKVLKKRNEKRHALTHIVKEKNSEFRQIADKDKMMSYLKSNFKYICDVCGKIDISKENRDRHMRVHERAKQNPCPECDASFQYLVELARHITKAHRQIEDGKTECPFCKKIVSAISHHLRTHEENPKQCERCYAVLSNYSAYKAHMRYHYILSNKGRDRAITPRPLMKAQNFHCSLCDKIFPRKIYLIQHFKCHVRFITHPCPFCPINTFVSYTDLMKHIGGAHMVRPKGLKDCDTCHEVVSDSDDQKPDQYSCESCSITFATKLQFNKHYNRRHKLRKKEKTSLHVLMEKYATTKLNFRKVACLVCHQKIRISHTKSHLFHYHRIYKCITCQKPFHNQESLRLHENLHDKTSVRCVGCSQSFVSHIRLMAHLKMIHKMAFSFSRACSRCKI